MRTARSLTVSRRIPRTPLLGATMQAPQSNHARPPEQPCMPSGATMHIPHATTHPLEQPRTPWSNHARSPEQPRKLPLTHASENITLPQLRCGR